MPAPIPYGRQWIDAADVAAVVACLRGDWLTQGPAVERFEQSLREAAGAAHAVASGAAAGHGGARSRGSHRPATPRSCAGGSVAPDGSATVRRTLKNRCEAVRARNAPPAVFRLGRCQTPPAFRGWGRRGTCYHEKRAAAPGCRSAWGGIGCDSRGINPQPQPRPANSADRNPHGRRRRRPSETRWLSSPR